MSVQSLSQIPILSQPWRRARQLAILATLSLLLLASPAVGGVSSARAEADARVRSVSAPIELAGYHGYGRRGQAFRHRGRAYRHRSITRRGHSKGYYGGYRYRKGHGHHYGRSQGHFRHPSRFRHDLHHRRY